MDKLSGNALKRARVIAGLTQERAAESVGYSVDAVQRWEDGSRRPGIEAVEALADAYGAPWLPALFWREISGSGAFAATMPGFEPGVPMAQAALKLLRAVCEFAEGEYSRHLMDIACDGVVDETEAPMYRDIMRCAARIGQATLELRFSR